MGNNNFVCFICDEKLNKNSGFKYIFTEKTEASNTDFCNKIGDLIDDSLCFFIGPDDCICLKCVTYVNHIDVLQSTLSKVKDVLTSLLRSKYGLDTIVSVPDEKENESSSIEHNVNNQNIGKYMCTLCDNYTETEELLKSHIEKHYQYGAVPFDEQCELLNVYNSKQSCTLCLNTFNSKHELNKHFVNCIPQLQKFSSEISINPIQRQVFREKKNSGAASVTIERVARAKSVKEIAICKPKDNNNQTVIDSMLLTLVDDVSQNVDESFVKIDKNKSFVCARCKFRTPHDWAMKSHIRSHLTTHVECIICEQLFKNKKTLRKHIKMHAVVDCNICNFHFTKPDEYWQHVELYHTEPGQKDSFVVQVMDEQQESIENVTACLLCGLVVTDLNHKCYQTTKYRCTECDLEFHDYTSLNNHREYDHRPGPFCKYCNKHITPMQKLIKHEKNHFNNKLEKIPCSLCPKTFKTRTGLDYHMAKHTGNYRIYCKECDKGFVSDKFLEEHMGVHTKDDRYVCDICGKKFCFNSTYRMHRIWHDNPLPYDCDICGKKFAHTSTRKLHIRQYHTGERPYKCSYCYKTFVRANVLKKHVMLHTNEYAYNCTTCDRGFTTRQKYANHLAKFHNDRSLLDTKMVCQYKMAIRPSERKINMDVNLEVENEATYNTHQDDKVITETHNYYEEIKYEPMEPLDNDISEYIITEQLSENSKTHVLIDTYMPS